YHQLDRPARGFVPELSILDLLFNMGPESPLILQASYHPYPHE
ncbi:MAG: WbqC family protein, partial [Porphyromonadaceae bacterium]|nr:WbqC family protein [Porphyromonadaceae bacterium]